MNDKNRGWLTTVLAQTVAAIAIVLWTAILIPLAAIGLLIVAVIWVGVTVWEWLTSLMYRVRNLFFLMRYLVTGDCGHVCDYATFYIYDTGKRVRLFVSEAGCPVHDSDSQFSRWIQKVKKENRYEQKEIQQ